MLLPTSDMISLKMFSDFRLVFLFIFGLGQMSIFSLGFVSHLQSMMLDETYFFEHHFWVDWQYIQYSSFLMMEFIVECRIFIRFMILLSFSCYDSEKYHWATPPFNFQPVRVSIPKWRYQSIHGIEFDFTFDRLWVTFNHLCSSYGTLWFAIVGNFECASSFEKSSLEVSIKWWGIWDLDWIKSFEWHLGEKTLSNTAIPMIKHNHSCTYKKWLWT